MSDDMRPGPDAPSAEPENVPTAEPTSSESETASSPPRRRRRRWPFLLLGGALVAAAVCGASLGYFMRLDLPDIRSLEDYTPPVMSRVLDRGGIEVASFAEQRRLLLEYPDIPESFLEALIATEDAGFYRHTGVDFRGIVRAAVSDVRHMRLAQGASTLTMQLARTLFLHRQKTWQRKLRELVLALEIERNYTKEEILRFYCNQIYMGHGRYGIEAGSRLYFGRSARELTLPEAALLAGVIQRPEALSPLKHPQAALARRNHVLERMVTVGYLTREEADAAAAAPLVPERNAGGAPRASYYVEEVRRWLKQRYGDTSVYQEGLEVATSLDPTLQDIADRAVEAGLRALDKRQGWRGVATTVPEELPLERWSSPDWERGIVAGAVIDAVVLEVADGLATLRIGEHRAGLTAKGVSWTGQKRIGRLLKRGDVVRVRLPEALDPDAESWPVTLEQEPVTQAALVALDPRTGEILAMTGGYDFEASEFNRATQARRQTGSAFKPLVFAAALDRGWSLADTILDRPTVFLDPGADKPYQPENYKHVYYGRITLRQAMEKSANITTVQLLHEVGYGEVIDVAKRLGVTADLEPYPSLALGAFEIGLTELTAAYGTFANGGVWIEPHFVREVRDHRGDVRYRAGPAVRDAVSPPVAHLMNRVLEGVISDGTGRAASDLGILLAGKTGTTDDFTDAWFVGYSPEIAVGVWVGHDVMKPLGRKETGARAALPIWEQFMREAHHGVDGAPAPLATRDDGFERPGGMRMVAIDRRTGLRANPAAGCAPVLTEHFVPGSEPAEYCSRAHHTRLELPHPLQRYALNQEGELEIPSGELDALLERDFSLHLRAGGRELVASTAEGPRAIRVRRLPGSGEPPVEIPKSVLERFDPSEWVGKDGRPAEIVVLRR